MKTIKHNGVEWNVAYLKKVSKTDFKKAFSKRYPKVEILFDTLKEMIKGV